MKITKTFPRIGLSVVLSLTFFLLPVNIVSASGYSSDSDFWRWWYIEHQTDAITNGQGVSAENIQDTDSGQNAGTVIYNQSGVTRGDFIDYVEEQYNQAEGYLQYGVDYYVNAVNNLYDSTVTTATKAAYETEKAVREVVDSAGNVVVDVSGSDFWHSVYNDMFNSQSYEHQYTTTNESMSGTSGGHNYTISFDGIYRARGVNLTYNSNGVFTGNYYESWETTTDPNWIGIFKVVDNGNTYYYTGLSSGVDNTNYWHFDGFLFTQQYVRATFSRTDGNDRLIDFYFRFTNGENTGVNNGTSVQQPYSIGFINYNGDKRPIYKDKDLNDGLTINDNGTVTDGNGNDYPIYFDPNEITPDGWLQLLNWLNNDDNTENPYNPFGRPWNTQDDGSALGGFFGNLVKDIGSVFKGLADTLSNLFKSLIDGILNALKSLFDIDFNSITSVELDVNFNIINVIWQKLLEILGVS